MLLLYLPTYYILLLPVTGLSARRAALVRRLDGRFVVAAGTSATGDSHVLNDIICFHLKAFRTL